MSRRARELADSLISFNDELIAFVDNLSQEGWQKVCAGEGWPVNVVARHIAAGHYGALDLAKLIVAGEPLPQLDEKEIEQMNAQHAEDHADCSKDEVLGFLRKKGPEIAAYVAGLSDHDLDRKGHLEVVGGDVSAEKFLELVILESGKQHFENMKATTGSSQV
jgi:hypothetical protein